MQRTEPSLMSQVRMMLILLVMQSNIQRFFANKGNSVYYGYVHTYRDILELATERALN